MPRLLETALAGSPEGFLAYLEDNGPDEFLATQARLGRLGAVARYLVLTPMTPFFLRPRGDYEMAIFESLTTVSPTYDTFFTLWPRLYRALDDHTAFAHLKPDLGAECTVHRETVGTASVYVKLGPLTRSRHRLTAANETRFSHISTALTLANLTCGLPPLSATFVRDGHTMVSVSADGGEPMISAKAPLFELVAQVPMALWALRSYGGLFHYDLHSSNIVVKPMRKRNLLWAWSFHGGLAVPHHPSPGELVAGIEIPGSTYQVCIIDGGFTTPCNKSRDELYMHLGDEPRVCGWATVDLDGTDAEIGRTVFELVTDNGRFVAIVLFEDIPDAVVDLVSFFVCLVFRGYAGELVYPVLGALHRVARDCPALDFDAFVEFMVAVTRVFEPVCLVARPRTPEDYVVPMPAPCEETTRHVASFRDAVFATDT